METNVQNNTKATTSHAVETIRTHPKKPERERARALRILKPKTEIYRDAKAFDPRSTLSSSPGPERSLAGQVAWQMQHSLLMDKFQPYSESNEDLKTWVHHTALAKQVQESKMLIPGFTSDSAARFARTPHSLNHSHTASCPSTHTLDLNEIVVD